MKSETLYTFDAMSSDHVFGFEVSAEGLPEGYSKIVVSRRSDGTHVAAFQRARICHLPPLPGTEDNPINREIVEEIFSDLQDWYNNPETRNITIKWSGKPVFETSPSGKNRLYRSKTAIFTLLANATPVNYKQYDGVYCGCLMRSGHLPMEQITVEFPGFLK